MSLHIKEATGVQDDLRDHYADIVANGQPQAAQRLLDAYEATTDRLVSWPESAHRFETSDVDLDDIRFCGMPSPFEAYQVFHQHWPEQSTLLILLSCTAR